MPTQSVGTIMILPPAWGGSYFFNRIGQERTSVQNHEINELSLSHKQNAIHAADLPDCILSENFARYL
jgi:hypothetical protein